MTLDQHETLQKELRALQERLSNGIKTVDLPPEFDWGVSYSPIEVLRTSSSMHISFSRHVHQGDHDITAHPFPYSLSYNLRTGEMQWDGTDRLLLDMIPHLR